MDGEKLQYGKRWGNVLLNPTLRFDMRPRLSTQLKSNHNGARQMIPLFMETKNTIEFWQYGRVIQTKFSEFNLMKYLIQKKHAICYVAKSF